MVIRNRKEIMGSGDRVVQGYTTWAEGRWVEIKKMRR